MESKETAELSKEHEEYILEKVFYSVVRKMPPEDIAIEMYRNNLLTVEEKKHNEILRDNHVIDEERSEHLLDCLRKRGAGFLRKFCDILKQIPPAQHIVDLIEEEVRQIRQRIETEKQLPTGKQEHMHRDYESNMAWKEQFQTQQRVTKYQLEAKNREIKKLRAEYKQLRELYRHILNEAKSSRLDAREMLKEIGQNIDQFRDKIAKRLRSSELSEQPPMKAIVELIYGPTLVLRESSNAGSHISLDQIGRPSSMTKRSLSHYESDSTLPVTDYSGSDGSGESAASTVIHRPTGSSALSQNLEDEYSFTDDTQGPVMPYSIYSTASTKLSEQYNQYDLQHCLTTDIKRFYQLRSNPPTTDSDSSAHTQPIQPTHIADRELAPFQNLSLVQLSGTDSDNSANTQPTHSEHITDRQSTPTQGGDSDSSANTQSAYSEHIADRQSTPTQTLPGLQLSPAQPSNAGFAEFMSLHSKLTKRYKDM